MQTAVHTTAPTTTERLEAAEEPFASIEGAHEYVSLLVEAVLEARESIHEEVNANLASNGRYLDALRLAEYKVCQLQAHLSQSGRILNDLRTLRRLIFEERS